MVSVKGHPYRDVLIMPPLQTAVALALKLCRRHQVGAQLADLKEPLASSEGTLGFNRTLVVIGCYNCRTASVQCKTYWPDHYMMILERARGRKKNECSHRI